MSDAGEEEVVTYSPDHQSRKSNCLWMELDIAIGLGIRKPAEHCSWRMADDVDQDQQRQYDTQGDALQDPQRQFARDDDDGKRPTIPGEQVAQVRGLREMQHCRDDDGG